jgi:hypothetical protein
MSVGTMPGVDEATDTVAGVVIRVPPSYCGRPGFANGGWIAGLAAGLLTGPGTRPGTPVEVKPRAVVPVDASMTGRRDGQGAFLVDGSGSVLTQASVGTDILAAPGFVTLAVARRAGTAGNRVESPSPGCFGCGFDREGGLRVTLGRADGDTFAGVWTPPAVSGEVPARYVWAALHCPAGLVFLEGGGRAVLERVTLARYRAPVSGEPNVVVAVPAGTDRGRRVSAAALYTSIGELVAHSTSAWTVG